MADEPAQVDAGVAAGNDAGKGAGKDAGNDAGNGPSKNALKKAQKEKEKAEKKAAAKRVEQEKQSLVVDEDHAKDNYGTLELDKAPEPVEIDRLTDAHVSKQVTVIARVHNSRSQSAKLAFIMLRGDGETIQAVLAAGTPEVSRQMVKWAVGVSVNSIVRVTGTVQIPDPPVASASVSGLEIKVTKMFIESETTVLPMQVKDAERPPPESAEEGQLDAEGAPLVTLKTRLDNRVIDLQTSCNQAILDISSGVKTLFSEYLLRHGFKWVDSPKLLAAATEGGGDVFEVSNYFGKRAYLAQSPQVYKQMLIAGDCKRVFEIAPVFRAEKSNSHRHMTEFTGLDFEMVFNHHYHEVLGFAEDLLVFIITGIQERYAKQIATVQKTYPKAGDFRIKDGKAKRFTYLEGVQMLKDAGVDTSEQDRFENDLTTAMEKRLGQIVREKYDTDFYVLDEFPMSVRPFYTKAHPHDKNLSNSYDFFMRGEEIMSGAQRINDSKELEESMLAKGVDFSQEGFTDYLNAFRQGCRLHAGGGLGLNRIVQFYLGLEDVRQATPFARDPHRLRP